MARIYTIGDTPEKLWRQERGRPLWLGVAAASGLIAVVCLQITIARPATEPDSLFTMAPLVAGVVFALLAGFAAYEGRMLGLFADEHPEMFEMRSPTPAVAPPPGPFVAPETGLFADPMQQVLPEADGKTAARQFCPYCGERVEADHSYCAFCGRELM